MSVGRILTLGLGSFGSVNFLPTLGYGSGGNVPPVVLPPATGGWPIHAGDRRRSKREIDEARRRFGIAVPEEVAEVILEAAIAQADDNETDAAAQRKDLEMRLQWRRLVYERDYWIALSNARQALIDQEIAARMEFLMLQRKNNSAMLFLMTAFLDS